jgi:hypothetical protein
VCALLRSKIYIDGAEKLNCQPLAVSYSAFCRKKAAFMPAAARLYCILVTRNLEMLALVFGLCRWSGIFVRLLVVCFRIVQISRLNMACAGPLEVSSIVRDESSTQVVLNLSGSTF